MLFVVPVMTVDAEDYRVVGYYPAWLHDAYPADMVNVSALTHVIYAFCWPREDGTLASYAYPSYPELTARVHDAGKTMMISLGGGGLSDGFAAATADMRKRALFISNVLAFCDQHGFDGVDIDWEYPQDETERDNMTALVRELRAATSGRLEPFIITVAITGSTSAEQYWDIRALTEYIDWFNVMHYNYSGTWSSVASHNAPLFQHSDMAFSGSIHNNIAFLTETVDVPREKILLGIPFYGRQFIASDLYASSTGGEHLLYVDIASLLWSGEWLTLWDDISKASYAINNDKTLVLVYDDERSVTGKCEYVIDNDLGGVMIWALGYDYLGDRAPLLDTIGQILGPPIFVEHTYDSMPAEIVMHPVVPNPFNASATITYTLPRDMNINVDIYSISGQLVIHLHDGFVHSGWNKVIWNADSYAAGIYFASVYGEGYRATEKMTLLK